MQNGRLLFDPILRTAFTEDLGRAGDLTSDAIIPDDVEATFALVNRDGGVISGLDIATAAFAFYDDRLRVDAKVSDGDRVSERTTLATISGPARSMLTAERTALNLLCRLSGIATATRAFVDAIEGTGAAIVDTRKTTVGLRALEKKAVRDGGGQNHRFGLDDAVLIKDNHIAVAGSVEEAVRRVKAHVGHLVKIEVEVDTLEQLEQLIPLGVDAVLLDNMSPDTLAKAVAMVDGKMITDASGGITLETARAKAAAGVDILAIGWLTHSAPILDIGLDEL